MKTMLRYLVVGMAAACLPALAFAGDPSPGQALGDPVQAGGPGDGAGFVDADGDGICDNLALKDGASRSRFHKRAAQAQGAARKGGAAFAAGNGVGRVQAKGSGQAMTITGDKLRTRALDSSCDQTQDRLKDRVRLSR